MQGKQQTALLDWGALQKFLVTDCFQVEKQILTSLLELKAIYVAHHHPPQTEGGQCFLWEGS